MDMCHGRPTSAIVDALNQNTIHFSRPPMGPPGPSSGIPLSYGNMPVHTQVRPCSEGVFTLRGWAALFSPSSAPPFVTDMLNFSKCRGDVFYYLPLVCSSNCGHLKFKYGTSASAKVLIDTMIIVCIRSFIRISSL